MDPHGDGLPGGTAPDCALRFHVRPASWGDIGDVARLYIGQSEASRVAFHPYPFGPVRLRALLAYMLLTQKLLGRARRHFPNFAFGVIVLDDAAGRTIGFGTIRLVRDGTEPDTWARFGFLVAEGYHRQGGGTQIVEALYESAVALGIRRGGGTIRASNVASTKVVEQFGFQLHETAEVDRNAPGDHILSDVRDLEPVLERIRERRLARTATPPAPAAPPPAAPAPPVSRPADA
jgi:RimJ/RimL family protein N-acetyltransferase